MNRRLKWEDVTFREDIEYTLTLDGGPGGTVTWTAELLGQLDGDGEWVNMIRTDSTYEGARAAIIEAVSDEGWHFR